MGVSYVVLLREGGDVGVFEGSEIVGEIPRRFREEVVG